MSNESLIAVFVDFENLAIGAKDAKVEFEVDLLMKRLLQKGRVVFKRAYCDWGRYRNAVREFHSHGIELVDIPQTKMSGKNSADIRMVVDALDLCYAKDHIDTFALISGDSDFSPLVSKLKENDKRVLGCGLRNSTSDLLISGCDEFIYYDDLIRESTRKKAAPKRSTNKATGKKQEWTERLTTTVSSLMKDYDPVWGSLVKQTIKRVYPGFDETYYGFTTFADLLEAGEKAGLIKLDLDESRGNFKVSLTDK